MGGEENNLKATIDIENENSVPVDFYLQFTEDLMNPSWKNVSTNQIPAESEKDVVHYPDSSMGFYRTKSFNPSQTSTSSSTLEQQVSSTEDSTQTSSSEEDVKSGGYTIKWEDSYRSFDER